jgi:hypothetical protein
LADPTWRRPCSNYTPRSSENVTSETWSRLFVEWLGSQGRAYVPKSELTLEEFVAAIEGSPTVLSIAHPS